MASKTMLSLLLACSVLVTLVTPQLAMSQTVITSSQYSASSSTVTAYSTIMTTSTSSQAAQYKLTPSNYDRGTGSFILGYTEEASGSPLSFDVQDYPCLFYDYFLLNATAGHIIRGHFELSMVGRAIDFFILNRGQFYSFTHSNCGYGLRSSMLHGYGPSYNMDWVVPESGEYALVFVSRIFYGGYVSYSAEDYAPTAQNETVAYTSTSVIENTNLVFLTQTPAVTSSPTSLSSENAFITWLPAALIVIAGIVIMGLLLRKRRS
jgi:hypothetical protein